MLCMCTEQVSRLKRNVSVDRGLAPLSFVTPTEIQIESQWPFSLGFLFYVFISQIL